MPNLPFYVLIAIIPSIHTKSILSRHLIHPDFPFLPWSGAWVGPPCPAHHRHCLGFFGCSLASMAFSLPLAVQFTLRIKIGKHNGWPAQCMQSWMDIGIFLILLLLLTSITDCFFPFLSHCFAHVEQRLASRLCATLIGLLDASLALAALHTHYTFIIPFSSSPDLSYGTKS